MPRTSSPAYWRASSSADTSAPGARCMKNARTASSASAPVASIPKRIISADSRPLERAPIRSISSLRERDAEAEHLDGRDGGFPAFVAGLRSRPFDGLLDRIRRKDSEDDRNTCVLRCGGDPLG